MAALAATIAPIANCTVSTISASDSHVIGTNPSGTFPSSSGTASRGSTKLAQTTMSSTSRATSGSGGVATSSVSAAMNTSHCSCVNWPLRNSTRNCTVRSRAWRPVENSWIRASAGGDQSVVGLVTRSSRSR